MHQRDPNRAREDRLWRWRRAVFLAGAALTLTVGVSGVPAIARTTAPALDSAMIDANLLVRVAPPEGATDVLVGPRSVAAHEADLPDEALVVALSVGSERRAYPLALVAAHGAVNDTIDGIPVLIWFCRACGSVSVYDRGVAEAVRTFEPSGLVYRSDELIVDREDGSLWSPLLGQAVSGPSEGLSLIEIPYRLEHWGAWRRLHPGTRIAAEPDGRVPLADARVWLDAVDRPDRYHPGMPTLGAVSSDGTVRAYPAIELLLAGGEASEKVGSGSIRVRYSSARQAFEVESSERIAVEQTTWSVWTRTHRETSVFAKESP